MNLKDASKRLALAHQAVMIEDAQKVLAQARTLTRQHQRMACEYPELPPENDMGIHIGDVILGVGSEPEPTVPERPIPPQPSPQPVIKKSLKSGILPAILSGIIGAAAGTGLAYLLLRGPDNSAYDVLFFDADGKPITVPHVSERKP